MSFTDPYGYLNNLYYGHPQLQYQQICEVTTVAAIELPCYLIFTESGTYVDSAKTEEDVRRKARNYASAKKATVYVLVPRFRFEPSEVPVTETDLSQK